MSVSGQKLHKQRNVPGQPSSRANTLIIDSHSSPTTTASDMLISSPSSVLSAAIPGAMPLDPFEEAIQESARAAANESSWNNAVSELERHLATLRKDVEGGASSEELSKTMRLVTFSMRDLSDRHADPVVRDFLIRNAATLHGSPGSPSAGRNEAILEDVSNVLVAPYNLVRSAVAMVAESRGVTVPGVGNHPPPYTSQVNVQATFAELEAALRELEEAKQANDFNRMSVAESTVLKSIDTLSTYHPDPEVRSYWAGQGAGYRQTKANGGNVALDILKDLGKGTFYILATPVVLAAAGLFGAGAMLYGTGKLLTGIGHVLTVGRMKGIKWSWKDGKFIRPNTVPVPPPAPSHDAPTSTN